MPDFKRFTLAPVMVSMRQGGTFQGRFLRKEGDWITLAIKTREGDCFLRISEIAAIALTEKPKGELRKVPPPAAPPVATEEEITDDKKEESPCY